MNEIIIIVLLVLLNGAFSMSEISLISARKSSLVSSAKKGNRSARIALNLQEEPDKFLSTVQIGITLIGILTGIYSGDKIAGLFSQWLESIGVTSQYASEISQTFIVVVVTYLTLVFGELLPKRIGMNNAEGVAKVMARPMKWLSMIASPFVWLLSKSTLALFSLFGMKNKSSKVTEDEIISIVQEGMEDGEVQEVEHDLVERVFLTGDLNVDSIMTHRRQLVWLDVAMTSHQVMTVLEKELYELYPVVDGDLDHILGVVSLKDLVLSLGKADFSLCNLVKDTRYFYRDMSVYKVLEQMKTEGVSRGLVCDEYGSCVGIVTLKDIMHALVGIVDEDTENATSIVKRHDKEEWIVDGQCPVHDFLLYFDSEDLYVNEDYTTVAGLCLKQFGHIPQAGESVSWNGFVFEVGDMDGVRIDKLLVTSNRGIKTSSEESD